MKITNNHNLPDAIVNAIKSFQHDYSDGRGDTDISVTELIGPPLIRQLVKKHNDEIVEDAADRIWSLLGNAIHNILEHSSEELTEYRMFKEVEGVKISGQADLISNDTIYDYKVTSVWSVLKGYKKEWEQQLNLLAYLYDKPLKGLKIVTILRDWSKGKSLAGGGYPDANVKVIDIPLWTQEEQHKYLLSRLEVHNNEPIECTHEEKWSRPTKFATMKKGRKSAVKLHDTLQEAEADKRGDHVEIRKGANIRCDSYCPVAKFCPYHRMQQSD